MAIKVNYGHPPLELKIEREAFQDIWTLTEPDGQSHDFWLEELKEWLLLRNMDEDQMNKALDEAYHFRRVTVVITNPRKIQGKLTIDDPNI